MGLFGSSAGMAQAGEGYGAPLSWADRLAILGAGLKDASPGSPGGNLMAIQQLMGARAQDAQKKALLAKLPGLFGGQAAAQQPPVMTDPGSGPTMKGPGEDGSPIGPAETPPTYALQPTAAAGPDWNRIAAAAPIYKEMGLDLAPSVEALKAGQPHIMVTPSGEAISDRDPSMAGRVFPTIEKGQIVLRDARGNPTGVMNLPGVSEAAGQTAGAVSNAQESAKAAYDLVPVPQSDGSTRLMPRSMALAAMSGMGGGQGGAAPGGPALGVSQTPAQKITAEGTAKTGVDRAAIQPKETAALEDLDNRSHLTAQIIHQILGDKMDPTTGKWTKGGQSMVGNFTTGVLGGALTPIYQPAHDLEAQIDHVKAMTSMDELQKLREESPTGAGLGRVTQQEINLLAAMRGSIDQKQSGGQFEQNLRRQLGQLEAISSIRQKQYQDTYGGGTGGASQPSSGRAAPPQPGQVIKGYRFLGGNPADPKSWAK